jgi:signal transduction histidine kinase
MTSRLPLRTRVTLLYTLMGLILSVLFACSVVFVAEDYEHVIVEEILASQAQGYSRRLETDPNVELPRTERLSAYLRRPDGSGQVPAALAGLPLGTHESDLDSEEGVHMGVFDTKAGRLYFTINLNHIERLERHLDLILAAVVVLGTLISSWLGYLLSGAVIQPVRRLADAVERLPPHPVQTSLGRDMPPDELGRLGTAIDEYQHRLVQAEEVERSFFADASHELRSPISVIRGASELLLEDSEEVPHLRPRLLRLDRGIRELSELLDALLRLARGRMGEPEKVVLRQWLGDCLAQADSIKEGKVQLAVGGDGGSHLLPASGAELVVHSIVRRLLPPTVPGLLEVNIGSQSIALRFIAAENAQRPSSGLQPRPSDRRLGLTLMGRLAEKIGWDIDDSKAEAGYVLIRLPRPAA